METTAQQQKPQHVGYVPADRAEHMEEAQAPEMFSFVRPGDEVCGLLRRIEVVEVKGKKVTQYLVEVERGRFVQFLATWDLQRKIRSEHRGGYIVVRFVGENKEVKKGDNYLREFLVKVEKGRREQANLEITDEDIPF